MASRLNLGPDFDSAVLQAAGLDPAEFDPDTTMIDFVPVTGDATVRATRVVSVPAETLRELIAQYGGPVAEEPSP